MKLVLVAPHFAPHFEGGTELVVRAQARALAARGHAVRVVAGTDAPHAGHDVERAEVDGVALALIPRRAQEPFDLALERPRIDALVRRESAGADLVHVHHWSTLSGRLVRVLAADAPVVVSLHDLFATCVRFFRRSPAGVECPPRGDVEPCATCLAPDAPGVSRADLALGLVARAAAFDAELAAAAALVVPSRAQAERLAELCGFGAERFELVPHGLCAGDGELALLAQARAARALEGRDERARKIEAGAQRSAREGVSRVGGGRAGPRGAESGGGGHELVVLHFGHRSEVKGTLDLVRALAALPAGSVRLVLAGSEVEAGFDARIVAEAGGLPIAIEGPYDLARLVALAAGADVAAFPSRAYESYGLVVDEALALGLPVWVADRGALGERVGGAGRVLPAEEPAAWTAAFREAQADPELLERQRAALPTRSRTAVDAARELEAIYRRILGTP